MEDHLIEDYPLLVALMRVECKDWSFLKTRSHDADLDDNIEEILNKTAWGLLRLFETKLRELDSCRKALWNVGEAPQRPHQEIKAMRCPFNPDIGCMNGNTGVLEEFQNENGWGTTFRESGIVCAAWHKDGNRCMRLYGAPNLLNYVERVKEHE